MAEADIIKMEVQVQKRKLQRTILMLIFMIPPIFLITMGLAWWQYPETYEFFGEFISDLGSIYSYDLNLPNTTSMIIFSSGLGLIALITFIISIIYFVKRNLKYWVAKGVFSLFLTLGAIGIAIPHDGVAIHPVRFYVHGIGAFLFVFGFAMFNFFAQVMRFTRKSKNNLHKKMAGYYFDIIISVIVLIALLFFLACYFLRYTGLPNNLPQISQKIVLIIDLVAIYFLDIRDM